MTTLIEELLEDLVKDKVMSAERRELLSELLSRVVAVAESDAHTKDLRVAVDAIDELLEAFTLFDAWRDQPKLTVFGSARTKPDSPLYAMTAELTAAMAERGWITVSGAGPGIMEAAAKGAGVANTLGVNIELPFEQFANDYVDVASKLVTMKYFFTRKVALTRPSIAFVVLPGGLGTMDELFEILTLQDTGKTDPAPIVLLDTPDGSFWRDWLTFIDEAIVTNEYVATDDMHLVRLATSITDTIDEIEHFYVNYRSFVAVNGRGDLALRRAPNDEQLQSLREAVPMFDEGTGYRVDGDEMISFAFDGRNYVNLRLVINEVNSWTDPSN